MNCALKRYLPVSCLIASLAAVGIAPAAQPADRPANRLAGETSPYLLMHAHNPVDWYPWGPDALQKARQENKLIFLSIGYSSCYWCHVMERESFMNDEVAAMLNEHFVCIKVDREERPDIDDLYMTSLQVYFQLIGSPQGGGWPLSMFLTPSGEPFFGGTYFPPKGRGRRAGFLDVLKFVHQLWEEKPDKIRQDGQLLVRAVRESRDRPAAEPQTLDRRPVAAALAALDGEFDAEHGGFGYSPANPRQPKFPEPANLFLLAELAARKQEPAVAGDDAVRSQEMLVTTLDKMARGGIWDHLGGGFHRYSTDRFWHVPHFEKMLYDNGQLLTVYAEGYALTGRPLYARVAGGIADFVLAEMTDPENGGFYSAIDAETDAEEGKFYAWTNDELNQLLTAPEQAVLGAVYGTQDAPVFEGKHVLLQRSPLGTSAAGRELTEEQLLAELAPIRRKLLDHRNQRERPLLDTKILTAWNGLMIRGLADAGRILEKQEYVDAAARAADFLLSELRTPEGRLQRTYRDGKAKLNAYVDDYAFLVNGLLALHRATGERRWLSAADELTAKQIELFWDDKQGGFFYTSHDHEELFARIKKTTDGALPAALSVSAENLLYLANQLDRGTYREHARRSIESNWSLLAAAPSAAPRMMVGLLRWLDEQSAEGKP